MNMINISEDILFMSYYYKTDLIFIIGNIDEFNDVNQKIDIDIKIVRNDRHVMLSFESKWPNIYGAKCCKTYS